ncbi:MAG: 6-bladed beta-propeller [Candidatus Zhuqueibacterota bacterium]
MKKSFALFFIFILFFSCSKSVEYKKIELSLEKKIGEDVESEAAWFSSLNDFWVDDSGRIFCADGTDGKIKIFDASGAPEFNFGSKGQGPGEFSYPNCIAVSQSGDIFVADAGRRSLIKFDGAGKFINSIQLGSPIVRMERFENGNLVVEIARFALGKDIKESIFELTLFDEDLHEIKNGIFSRSVEHYAWIDVSEEHSVTQPIPFAPRIVWHVIGNRLFVGYTDEFKISIFDEAGNFLQEFSKQVPRENVPGAEKGKWIERTLKNFEGRPGINPSILQKSMEGVNLPAMKPAIIRLSRMENNLLVFGNESEKGFPAAQFNDSGEEQEQVVFPCDDFKYFGGKYYRMIISDNATAVLAIYHSSE